MEIKQWECKNCGKKFKTGDWFCQDGITNHLVENREYLLNDAPSDPGFVMGTGMDSRRDGRTRICNMPPDKRVMVNGEASLVPGGYVEFVRGRFSTSDPEIQYWLDKKGGFCTQKDWEAAWLSDGQRMEIERMNMAAERQKLVEERNSLLEQVQAQKRGGVEKRAY